jgi:hypothetical protein
MKKVSVIVDSLSLRWSLFKCVCFVDCLGLSSTFLSVKQWSGVIIAASYHVSCNLFQPGTMRTETFIFGSTILLTMGWTALVRFPAGQDFPPIHRVQTGSGAHPPSYVIGIEGDSPWVKQLGREADHSPPCSADVKNGAAKSPLSHMRSWHSA